MTRVYAWATGQADNLGDSVLRRPYLDTLRKRGPLHVWVRNATPGFQSGLGIGPHDHVVSEYLAWYLGALLSTLVRPTVVAINAGEMRISRSGAVRLACLLPLLWMARLRRRNGGGGVWVGAGIPERRRPYTWVYKSAAKSVVAHAWRDSASISVTGIDSFRPDWAFLTGASIDRWSSVATRRYLAVTLRGDREIPTQQWKEYVAQLRDSLGLRLIVISQVRRDNGLAADLAREFGADAFCWEGDEHAEHERRVRAIYADSAVVLSDRLHALIIGASEGAVPLAAVERSTQKVKSHFEPVGLSWVGAYGASAAEFGTLSTSELDQLRGELEIVVGRCRSMLDDMREQIAPARG